MSSEESEDDVEPVQFLCRGGEASESDEGFPGATCQPAVDHPAVETVGRLLWNPALPPVEQRYHDHGSGGVVPAENHADS